MSSDRMLRSSSSSKMIYNDNNSHELISSESEKKKQKKKRVKQTPSKQSTPEVNNSINYKNSSGTSKEKKTNMFQANADEKKNSNPDTKKARVGIATLKAKLEKSKGLQPNLPRIPLSSNTVNTTNVGIADILNKEETRTQTHESDAEALDDNDVEKNEQRQEEQEEDDKNDYDEDEDCEDEKENDEEDDEDDDNNNSNNNNNNNNNKKNVTSMSVEKAIYQTNDNSSASSQFDSKPTTVPSSNLNSLQSVLFNVNVSSHSPDEPLVSNNVSVSVPSSPVPTLAITHSVPVVAVVTPTLSLTSNQRGVNSGGFGSKNDSKKNPESPKPYPTRIRNPSKKFVGMIDYTVKKKSQDEDDS